MEKKIEAILFYKNEPVSIKKLATILETNEDIIRQELKKLSLALENRGICLVMTGDCASLNTNSDMSELIEKIAKDEMSREIGKAGLETLSIVVYNGEISRRDIDYIRGVNSGFILRNLLIRGLVEKVPDPKDSRTFKYKPSIELLAHLGIKTLEELPDRQKFIEEITSSLSEKEDTV
jgi:segregation and condensation protein B